MCSGSEAGSYIRLIDFVHQSTLGLRVIKKKKKGIVKVQKGKLLIMYCRVRHRADFGRAQGGLINSTIKFTFKFTIELSIK